MDLKHREQKELRDRGPRVKHELKKNIRNMALHTLLAIHRDGAYANVALQETIRKEQLGDLDRRFFTELVYGVLRRQNYLDAIITHLSGKPIRKLSSTVVDILRLGIYQLMYMDKVPASAAVNESVKLAKKKTKGLDRFVNALLRNVERKWNEINIDHLSRTEGERISYIYNQPLWLVDLWTGQYGIEKTIDLCEWFNLEPRLVGRVNTLKIDVPTCIDQMIEAGWVVEQSPLIEDAIYIDRHVGMLQEAPWVREGMITFMDEASMAVSYVVDPKPGEKILDLCAAPGGKSIHMAHRMNNVGSITSGDIHGHKVELMKENAKRLGASIVEPKLQDGRHVSHLYGEEFDRVLVDAPCSGLGILQKKLDMRWRKEEGQLQDLPQLQYELLVEASKIVKPGGVLIYSTCTINQLENEGVVEKFLENHPNFHIEDASAYVPFQTEGPMVTLWPPDYDMDGFFIARMGKEK